MRNLILIYGALIILSGCKSQSKPEIIQFYTYTKEVDSFISLDKMRVYYNYFFLVKNYTSKENVRTTIDSFAIKFLKTGKFSPNKEEVRIWFYRETARTNIEKINANPREVDRYSNQHDLVWGYTLLRNNFIKKEKFLNGEVVQTNFEAKTPIPKFDVKKLENIDSSLKF